MMWNARTLEDELRGQFGERASGVQMESLGLEVQGIEYQVDGRGVTVPDLTKPAKVQCKGCGIWKNPIQLIDARGLDFWPHDYVCDGCRYVWHREGLSPRDVANERGLTGVTDAVPLTIGRLAELLGAPAAVVQTLKNVRRG